MKSWELGEIFKDFDDPLQSNMSIWEHKNVICKGKMSETYIFVFGSGNQIACLWPLE